MYFTEQNNKYRLDLWKIKHKLDPEPILVASNRCLDLDDI